MVKATQRLGIPRKSSSSFKVGVEVVSRACEAPMRQIIENGGGVPDIVLQRVVKSRAAQWGYNAKTEKYGNLIEQGVIDPKKVVSSAIENAISVAINFLSVGAAMIEDLPTN